jgi:hypothetical protein
VVLSADEVVAFLEAVSGLKGPCRTDHRLCAGLRAAEAAGMRTERRLLAEQR